MVPVSYRRAVAVLAAVLSVLQAFDSGIRDAAPVTIVAVAAALALPVIAFWFSARSLTHVVASVVAIGATLLVRAIEPAPLPALTLAAWFPAIAAIVLSRLAPSRSTDVRLS